MIDDSTRILVLCTGNSCRSQMAEGLLRQRLKERFLPAAAAAVRSAGLEPQGVNPLAIRVMAESGVDISRQTSDHLDCYSDTVFDYLITVCDNAAKNCPTFAGAKTRLHWPFKDPATATGSEEQILDSFRRVRDQIDARVDEWLAQMSGQP